MQRFPELIFGIAGPIGIEADEITDALASALDSVDYKSIPIRVTTEIEGETTSISPPETQDYYAAITYKMDHASQLCRDRDDPATLMRYVIRRIFNERLACASPGTSVQDVPALACTAFIVRQLKRPEEVELMRSVYGKQFVLVSAYGPQDHRKRNVETKLQRSLPLTKKAHDISALADKLIFRDMDEHEDDHGQHLRDTFHRADVFIDGMSKSVMSQQIARFINALFGKTDIAPTKAEYGMYAAKSASLRSSDLSRQVGAAIFTDNGELITQGCNEVPKAFGGTYWDMEEPDHRDVKLGYDPNDILKREVVRDFLERLEKHGLLSEKAQNLGGSLEIVDALTKRPEAGDVREGVGALVGAQITDLTEYGRVVHAEMCAICDAARLGRSVRGGVLYCTTFPCHNCTKHILAAGIKRVVYMEPYPKSKAKELHAHEIEIESESSDCVAFLPFLGISPYRYRDIFQKGKRKKDGAAIKWYRNEPQPMMDIAAPVYTQLEIFEIAKLMGHLQATLSKGSSDQDGDEEVV